MTQLKTPTPRRPRRPRMTYEQFLQWDGHNQHVEWVNGEVVEMPPVSGPHNLVGHFLLHLLDLFVQAHRLGEIRSDPFQMKTEFDRAAAIDGSTALPLATTACCVAPS